MKTDLSNIHPTIAGALSGALSSPLPEGAGKNIGSDVTVDVVNGNLVFRECTRRVLIMTPAMLRNFEQFLVSCGWRCS